MTDTTVDPGTTGAGDPTDGPAWRRLRVAGLVFAAGSAIHMVDHLRRGQGSVTDTLNTVGTLALVLQVVVITLIATRHRLAPLVAASAGFPLAVGFLGAHWLPDWGPISDPLWDMGSSWPVLSYVASTAEILGAVAVGVTGLVIVRAQGLASFGTPRQAHRTRPA